MNRANRGWREIWSQNSPEGAPNKLHQITRGEAEGYLVEFIWSSRGGILPNLSRAMANSPRRSRGEFAITRGKFGWPNLPTKPPICEFHLWLITRTKMAKNILALSTLPYPSQHCVYFATFGQRPMQNFMYTVQPFRKFPWDWLSAVLYL